MEISYKVNGLAYFMDDIERYNFTINGGRLKTEFSKSENGFNYLGLTYTEKAVVAAYIKKQLVKDLSDLQKKICIYKPESLPEDVWQIFSTIYQILETLEGSDEELPIEALYVKMPNNESESSYTLNTNWVRVILLQLKIVNTNEAGWLLINELGVKILRKYREGMRVRIREREIRRGGTGMPALKGRTVCLKCDRPIENTYTTLRMLCFKCRREEAEVENATD